MTRIAIFTFAGLVVLPVSGEAQMPPEFTEAEEIALARSAAPSPMTRDATFMVLRDGHYEVAHQGTSGVTCAVMRTWPLSLEPICYDPEASKSILQLEIRRVEARIAGMSTAELDDYVARLVGSGEVPLPTRPALAYMLSSGQVLYADAETRVGAFVPHIHVYWPYATAEQFGALGEGPSEAIMIDAPGEPTANLMIFARDFVDPVPPR